MTLSSFGSGVQLAVTTTREHKMRSFLTILGVIIGTGAVIGVGSIIAGLDGAITGLLRSFGPNTVIVTKTTAMGAATRDERRRQPLTLDDARAIEQRSPAVQHVSAYLFPPNGIHSARYKGTTFTASNSPEPKKPTPTAAPPTKYGRFFTDQENLGPHSLIVLVGEEIAKSYCRARDPVGEIDRGGCRSNRRLWGVRTGRAASLPGQDDTVVPIEDVYPPSMRREHMLMSWLFASLGQCVSSRCSPSLRDRPPRAVQMSSITFPSHDGPADPRAVPQSVTAMVALVMIILELDRAAGGRHLRDEHHGW